MKTISNKKQSLEKATSLSGFTEKLYQPAPVLFKHHDLTQTGEFDRVVNKEALVNRLNHINFMNGSIQVHLRHPKYDDIIHLEAYPEPCLGREFICRLLNKDQSALSLEGYESYHFLHLIIDDSQSVLLVPAILKDIDGAVLTFQLPVESYIFKRRRLKRYSSRHIKAELNQNGFLAKGELLDFSPIGFRIKVKPASSPSFHWFNPEELVSIHLIRDGVIAFSGPCKCIRRQMGQQHAEIVLRPENNGISRFKKKRIRSHRQQLPAAPYLVFDHPFLKKRAQLKVSDISPSGFLVFEKTDGRTLVPGMIIYGMSINFAGSLTIKCDAQVIYCSEEDEKVTRCGLAILDMDIKSYSRLNHILINALDPDVQVANEVDMDELWDFFFETGFIYPKKYGLLQSNREAFKKTYQNLYQERPEIAKHFICQDNGRIYGHMSMARAYERAWLIHHHAARTSDSMRAGFKVLKQVMHYLNGMVNLPSANIGYVMCYFRPENKFPDRVFGGFARDLNNIHGCSMDLFSYLPYTAYSLSHQLPYDWSLKRSTELDLWELNRSYKRYSGGLLLSALEIGEENPGSKSLEEVFAGAGLRRKIDTYSLTYKDNLCAVLIVDQSDLGFNLSELLNGIKIVVTNPEDLPWNILFSAISQLTGVYHMDKIPVMVLPFEYVKNKHVPHEKQYQLWILNLQYGNEYLQYMQKKFRTGY